MSYDKSSTEYCLTPNGWLSAGNIGPNEIIVERWLEQTYQGSGFGKESTRGTILSLNAEFSKEQRDELRRKFPAPWSEEMEFQRKQEFSRNLEKRLKNSD